LVALLLGLFVVRPILLGSPPLALPNTTTGQTPSLPALSGEISNEPAAQSPSEQDAERPASIAALSAPQIDSSPVERLRTLIGDRQEETVEILRGWLEDREENV
jgi:flagellar M-ring protein FliF